MKKFISILLMILITLTFIGCSDESNPTDKLSIVAVSFPEYDFSRAVAGNAAEITMLIPAGGEAHNYEPTVSDIKAVKNCDLFVYTGGESDSWVIDLLESVNNENIRTLALTNCVETLCCNESAHAHDDDENHDHSHDKFTVDEHVWTSPKNAILITDSICSALCETNSINADVFKANAESYKEKLQNLHAEIQNAVNAGKKNTLVFGDRFPLLYFANEYNLSYKAAFSGCSEDTEASASKIAELIDFVKDQGVSVVFTNELSNTSIADRIAKETGAEMLTFYSCHKISKDDFETGMTYVDIMSRNIDNLNKALK